eukprot:5408664-Alexandrium_andersonii.AAC.1
MPILLACTELARRLGAEHVSAALCAADREVLADLAGACCRVVALPFVALASERQERPGRANQGQRQEGLCPGVLGVDVGFAGLA